MQKMNSKACEDFDLAKFAKPQGAPRGLLLHYILFKISQRPSHGYELLQEIEEKTQGAWRPGSGSLYPLLKKLVSGGFIVEESSPKKAESSQRIYKITPKGTEQVKKATETFANMGLKWGAMRRIFSEMLTPELLCNYFVVLTRSQLDIARETLESKLSLINDSDAEYILSEYSLNLKHQHDWTLESLNRLKQKNAMQESAVIPTKKNIARK